MVTIVNKRPWHHRMVSCSKPLKCYFRALGRIGNEITFHKIYIFIQVLLTVRQHLTGNSDQIDSFILTITHELPCVRAWRYVFEMIEVRRCKVAEKTYEIHFCSHHSE